ncbi:hypothetical protein PTKU64_30530 [Paraburkholderia terrae]|uniref:Methyltransferase FkbM domain-containing protein n=1 Tax=Paraburkholderia terrae TaxID=311230 RepID=A0ABM7TK09_9BURK|nr:hypothetical protein [Paraburkholderia terrae]BCZ79378.1 hypothetical protein PTKU64_30530 [Paraburkholderia terrae]
MSDDKNLAIYNHFLSAVFPVMRNLSLIMRHAESSALETSANPLARFGAKVYSQNDEDGITFEILRRVGISSGVFAEFGVGDGTENNTLALVARGWKGLWVGNQDLAFNTNPDGVQASAFSYQKAWITRSNIDQLFQQGMRSIRETQCQLISLDLDGNDYYFVDALLKADASPEVFIVEYNGKFIPPIRFVIDYNDQHNWTGNDYFGASFSSFVDLFAKYGYFPACCNITGSNAFFVKNKYKDRFRDVPDSHDLIYAPPKYFLGGLDTAGHPSSIAGIESLFRKLQAESAARSSRTDYARH